MLSFRKPQPQVIRDFLAQQRRLDVTYETVGATAGKHPAGFVLDHTRVELGTGENAFMPPVRLRLRHAARPCRVR